VKVLIAEDDAVSNDMLSFLVKQWGYQAVSTHDGAEAWETLQQDDPPPLAILDWLMPQLDGIEVCRRARAHPGLKRLYLIMLTSMTRSDEIVAGLQSGANDYVVKPFKAPELHARIDAGARMVALQAELGQRVSELERALSEVKQLRGIVPICSYCKKIRDDTNYWERVEDYFARHTEAKFSHSFCPECYEKFIKPQLSEMGITPMKE
jgi:sigma-B regulation protein RsbU (phosphoserine phosphatase)